MRDQPDPEDLSAPITAAESRLLERLRANPIAAARLGAIMDRFDDEVNAGMDAHEAEDSYLASNPGADTWIRAMPAALD